MCSRRSCPTQKARPTPVSTTQRTAWSLATRCRVASRTSLVATSSAFIASGRLKVTVATPPVRSSSTAPSGDGEPGVVELWAPGLFSCSATAVGSFVCGCAQAAVLECSFQLQYVAAVSNPDFPRGDEGTIMVSRECAPEVLGRARPYEKDFSQVTKGITHGGDEAEDRGRAA